MIVPSAVAPPGTSKLAAPLIHDANAFTLGEPLAEPGRPRVIVANTMQVQPIAQSRQKDDRLDPQTLARLARVDPSSWLPQYDGCQRTLSRLFASFRPLALDCAYRHPNHQSSDQRKQRIRLGLTSDGLLMPCSLRAGSDQCPNTLVSIHRIIAWATCVSSPTYS